MINEIARLKWVSRGSERMNDPLRKPRSNGVTDEETCRPRAFATVRKPGHNNRAPLARLFDFTTASYNVSWHPPSGHLAGSLNTESASQALISRCYNRPSGLFPASARRDKVINNPRQIYFAPPFDSAAHPERDTVESGSSYAILLIRIQKLAPTRARLLHIPIENSNSSHFLQDSRGKEIEISRMPRLTPCETNFHNPISDMRSSTLARYYSFPGPAEIFSLFPHDT